MAVPEGEEHVLRCPLPGGAGFPGSSGEFPVTGRPSVSPWIGQVDENTIPAKPASTKIPIRFRAPATLLRKWIPGPATDSPALVRAAK